MSMSIPMPPPPAPYSLRVELFADPSFTASEKPIRCFRVSTQPSATVREFCIKACSTYKINYGETLTVKKCQDDEGFDITQGEVLGNIFQNKDTIRMIQASENPNPRDSVPPTSALRYEPSNFALLPHASAPLQIEAPIHYTQAPSRKRDRENSVLRATSSKRQRKENSGPDPDLPLPSLETQPQLRRSPSINGQPIQSLNGRIGDFNVVPNSQGSLDLDLNTASIQNLRNVQPEIPETPSPPPSSPNDIPIPRSPSTGLHSRKSTNLKSVENLSSGNIKFIQAVPAKEQFQISNTSNPSNPRSNSASYHIPAGERGTSVSTAATSPLSEEVVNGNSKGSSKRKGHGSLSNGLPNSVRKFVNGNGPVDKSIWDVPSGDEGDDNAAVNSLNKATRLMIKNSPKTGLPGRDFANKIKTPPNNPRRNSRTGTNGHTPGELPLTPGSRERYEKQKQESENAKKPRAATAAALAAEQRRQQAEENKATDEDERIAGEERSRREEQEKLRKDEAKWAADAEAEAEAARLRVELANREKKEAAEAKRKSELKAQKDEERIAKERAESERMRIETEEARRVREVEEERNQRERSASAAKKASELAQAASRVASDSVEPRQNRRSVSGTPGPNRPQSSTPFIPTGRKSSLKSSPSVYSKSPDVGIEAQMPLPKPSLPKDKNRRISFADGTKHETPIKPPTKVLPRKAGAVQTSTPKSVPARSVPESIKKPSPAPSFNSKQSSSTPSAQKATKPASILPPARKSSTPILPPTSILKASSKERSNSPLAVTKTAPAQKKPSPPTDKKVSKSMPPPPKKITPLAQTPSQAAAAKISCVEEDSEASGSGSSSDSDSDSASHPIKKSSVIVNPKFKPVKPQVKEASKEKPEETKSASVQPVEPGNQSTALKKITPNSDLAEDEKADDASERSSARDSRSPITFSQHPQPAKITKPQRKVSPASDSSSDEEDDEDEIMEDAPAETKASKSDSESDGESSEEEEEAEEPRSSPQLPPHRTLNNSSITGKDEFDEEDTQEEIANQLTSDHFEARPSYVSSDIKYPPSSSAVALPPSSRPSIAFGASLSQLNTRNRFLAPSTTNRNTGPQLSQKMLKKLDSDEEDEESNDDSSSEEEASKKKPIVPAKAPQRVSRVESSSSGSGSDSDSSVSDTESVKERKRIADEVSAAIADFGVKGSQASDVSSIPSPQVLRSQAGYGKTAGRKMGANMFSKPGL